MSRIENNAISVGTKLIKGDEFLLDTEGQRKLAAFLCLMAMRLEFLGRMRAIPPSDRVFLKDHGEPPGLWTIWIAGYRGENADEHWSRYCGMQIGSTPAEKVGPDYCNTQVTTMVIGKLCAHLFSSTETPILGYEGIRLMRVWPLTDLDMNTRFLPTIPENAILWLHEALARESTPISKAPLRGSN